MNILVKGMVEVEKIRQGKIVSLTRDYNNFLVKGEDFLASFLAKTFLNKYDANEGFTQAGYFDFVAIGTGFKSPADGTDQVLVLPNKPYGVEDENVTAFDSKTVRIHSGLNAGVNGVVAENGYNPANPDFGNLPTITLTDPLVNPVSAGVQFSIAPILGERTLQGEGRADHKGATFLNQSAYRVAVSGKKTLSAGTDPIGAENEILITAVLGEAQVSGGDSVLIVEAGIVNSVSVPVSPDLKSGEMLARVLMTPVEKEPDTIINLRWRLRIGGERPLSI